MPAPTILPWVDRALEAGGHPKTQTLVRRGRHQQPRKSWDAIAVEISALSGGTVNGEWLRANFGHLDPQTCEAK